MDEDTEAIIRQTVARFREIANEHMRNQERLDEIWKSADRLNERQDELQKQANRCYATADLFGFDLATALARAGPPDMPTQPTTPTLELPPPESEAKGGRPTVRDFILERARLAYPNPVRAAQLRRAYEELTGRAVHDKTFGMSMYRMATTDGTMKRVGAADWYFVPEDQRVPQTDAP